MSIICGVDEAGRGCVIGPLVMVALSVKEDNLKKLEWIGVKDSKLLSKEAREELFGRIREIVEDFRVEVIEPDAIDHALNDPNSNLNWLEADTSAKMVSELKPDKIIVDCPSTNIANFKAYFESRLSEGVRKNSKVIMEHKADMNYIVVAAASVIAKVIRDWQLEKIKLDIKKDFGSGYMSDQKTQKFLKEYHDKFPEIFRKTWKSFQRVEEEKKQKSLSDY
ncbi:ribonuclease HII [archaeon]|jgi:ribonuclease HII|nr:ribonuclease HII [archaeon]MBT3451602.1 ribonuclease HII [archaeon]MBT6869622.1 ribonuclease HII [archaeon]MBT7192391.1 ribonuclease HII [archaeon]MBT7380192.1 ribonuclease HII [archaeon]